MRRSSRTPRGVRIRSHGACAARRESGVALIAVLWLIVLLTLLASAVATLSVTHRRVVERYADAVGLENAEDSAIRVILLRFLAGQDEVRAQLLAQPQVVRLFERELSVTLTREAGRVDLNAADPNLLFALFCANGWQERDARLVTDEILRWRGNEGGGRPNSTSTPPQTPFESVEELRQALGGEAVTPELDDALTVYSHLTLPVEAAASPAARRALSWADQRELGGQRWTHRELASEPQPASAELSSPLAGEVLRVRSCLRERGEGQCRLAIVRPTGNLHGPFEVFVWRSTRSF
jgi:hypothetical protein